jgi:hypothetical protein
MLEALQNIGIIAETTIQVAIAAPFIAMAILGGFAIWVLRM